MVGTELRAALAAPDARLSDLAMYAKDLGMKPGDEEGERGFRERVAGELRSAGRVIEAHEVIVGRRYDDPEGGDRVVAGLYGAAAQALGQGPPIAGDPVRQLGDEFALGVLASAPPNPLDAMFEAFGPGATMDILKAFGGGR